MVWLQLSKLLSILVLCLLAKLVAARGESAGCGCRVKEVCGFVGAAAVLSRNSAQLAPAGKGGSTLDPATRFKTVMCTFFLAGTCTRGGDDCHEAELRSRLSPSVPLNG